MTIHQKNRIGNVATAVRRTNDELIDSGLSELVDIIRKSMKMPKSGRMYGAHRASAPGQPPAIWTGQLYASISKQRTGPTSGAVYTGVEHARYLEYGTHKRGKLKRSKTGQFLGGHIDAGMRPRPFMRPAARKMRLKWKVMSQERLAVVIHRAARG